MRSCLLLIVATAAALASLSPSSSAAALNVSPNKGKEKRWRGERRRGGDGVADPSTALSSSSPLKIELYTEAMEVANKLSYAVPLIRTRTSSSSTRPSSSGPMLRDSPYLNGRADLRPEYRSGGAITFDFSGTEVSGELKGVEGVPYSIGVALNYPCMTSDNGRQGNLLGIFLDGTMRTVIDLGNAESQAYCEKDAVFTFALDQEGSHAIRVVKLTEPNYNSKIDNTHNNVTFIHLVLTSTVPVQLLPLPPKALKMEFVGDSITCGYMINCKDQNSAVDGKAFAALSNEDALAIKMGLTTTSSAAPPAYSYESVLKAYGGVTCANLDAHCHYISWSGRGMAMNLYDGTASLVSKLYNYTMATVLDGSKPLWDFSLFTPDIVVINLGTNDFSNPAMNTTANIQKYVDTYTKFMWQVASTYGLATTSIVALCGPMSYKYCDSVEAAVANVVAAHSEMKRPYFMRVDDVLTPDNRCSGHPDAAISVVIGKQLTDFIQTHVLTTIHGN